MTLFQLGTLGTAGGSMMATSGLPGPVDQSQTHARPTDPGTRTTRDRFAAEGPASPPIPDMEADLRITVIDRLLPELLPVERERLGLKLAEQAAARLAWHWHALAGDGAAPPSIALDAPELGSILPTLMLSLKWPAALMLLAGDLADPAMVALASPVAAARESALEAMESGSPLSEFDQACQTICKAHLKEALERLSPGDRETYSSKPDRKDDGAPSQPVDPVPALTHQTATEPALLAALRSGNKQHAIRVLAAAALVPIESIETAISLRSRRGLVSLAWKAGFSMRAAVLLQTELGGFRPSAVLTATSDGSCPLNRSEMVWQIGFLARKLI